MADLDVGADVLGERWSVGRVDGVQIVANLNELMPDLQKKIVGGDGKWGRGVERQTILIGGLVVGVTVTLTYTHAAAISANSRADNHFLRSTTSTPPPPRTRAHASHGGQNEQRTWTSRGLAWTMRRKCTSASRWRPRATLAAPSRRSCEGGNEVDVA